MKNFNKSLGMGIFTIMFIVVSTTVFGQQGLPLKYGIELDGKLKKMDPERAYDSPTGVASVGVFAEYFVTNHFSGKLKVEMNSTYYHRDDISITFPTMEETFFYPGMTAVKQTLGISFEPRIYFFSREELRKINLYVALPIVYEPTPASRKEKDFFYVRSELMIVPTFGIRYDFNKHWGIEASGMFGWGKYYNRDYDKPPTKNKVFEYGLSLGVRYAF